MSVILLTHLRQKHLDYEWKGVSLLRFRLRIVRFLNSSPFAAIIFVHEIRLRFYMIFLTELKKILTSSGQAVSFQSLVLSWFMFGGEQFMILSKQIYLGLLFTTVDALFCCKILLCCPSWGAYDLVFGNKHPPFVNTAVRWRDLPMPEPGELSARPLTVSLSWPI